MLAFKHRWLRDLFVNRMILLLMKEGDSLAEIIKVEPVVDTFIHRSLLRFNLGVGNFY